jgi:DNA polymerase-3 subunit delta'
MTDDELWANVVGQAEAVAFLRAAVASPVHAYLFIGPPGAGRATAARAFAGSILASGTEGDDAERHRRLAGAGRHPDLVWVSPGGRALLVADAEGITVEASRSPIEAGRKVMVIDRFDTAEPESAANLLKTIEEPPATVVFVLLAEEVPPEHVTIASRCVRVDLPPLPDGTIADALVGDGETPERAVQLAAASAGSLDRARLLADDPTLQGRRDAWWSVPDRIDGTGAAVAVLVEELRGLIDDGQKPLTARHEQEVADLAEQEEAYGNRGSGRRQMEERQRREARRFRDDELRFGLATLARRYRDLVVGGRSSAMGATARITEVGGELVRNPNEALLLQALFLDLPAVSEA